MKWQLIVVGLVALPVLALFVGFGFLAYQIGQSWDARTTAALITGLVATCGGGVVVIGLLLALIVGIPLAIRLFSEAGYSRRAWPELPPPAGLPALPFPDRTPRAIDTTWHPLPAPTPAPPWGMTGGGNLGLLPPPSQDQRFGLAALPPHELAQIKRAWGEP